LTDVMDRANDALRRGAWQDARTLYEDALKASETPEALEGLGQACITVRKLAAQTVRQQGWPRKER
jgi:hypothetical protein